MSLSELELKHRALTYAGARGTNVGARLGSGNDGTIWTTDRKSAIKAFEREASYLRERDAYLRLQARGVAEVLGLRVPRFLECDDALMIVEMGIVSPPFLLDFGKAYVDHPPEFSPEVLRDWEREKSDLFGRDWPRVKAVLGALRGYGIYYFDASAGNIRFDAGEACED